MDRYGSPDGFSDAGASHGSARKYRAPCKEVYLDNSVTAHPQRTEREYRNCFLLVARDMCDSRYRGIECVSLKRHSKSCCGNSQSPRKDRHSQRSITNASNMNPATQVRHRKLVSGSCDGRVVLLQRSLAIVGASIDASPRESPTEDARERLGGMATTPKGAPPARPLEHAETSGAEQAAQDFLGGCLVEGDALAKESPV
eukprot:4329124-Amphidinium_carterae.1